MRHNACAEVKIVLHEAALGSVLRSIDDPINTNANNIDGFLNMLVSARDSGLDGFVYVASSSTYGDHPDLPKIEHAIGRPLFPYAVTKYVNELYADVFARTGCKLSDCATSTTSASARIRKALTPPSFPSGSMQSSMGSRSKSTVEYPIHRGLKETAKWYLRAING